MNLPVKPKGDRDIIDADGGFVCFANIDRDQIVLAINSYEKLVSELRASDNWLHRLLKSCVILLIDSESTKRAVEKQSRYNQQALKETENQNEA